MFRFQSIKFLKFAVAAAAFVSQAAFAAPVSFSGELTGSDPVFNRPAGTDALSTVGLRASYDVHGFHVSANGEYAIESTSFNSTIQRGDSYLFLYRDSFNPGAPLANLLQADDDSGTGLLSLMHSTLTASTQYYLVFTSYYSFAYGTYTGRFQALRGDGQVSLGEVPEPATLALLPLALLGMRMARRRNRG